MRSKRKGSQSHTALRAQFVPQYAVFGLCRSRGDSDCSGGVVRSETSVNIGTLLSFAASLLLWAMGSLLVVISGAPGWRSVRLYSLIAFTGAGYAVIDVLFSLNTMSDEVARLTGVFEFFFASLHAVAWLALAHGSSKRPLGDLPRSKKWIAGITILLGTLALFPSLTTRPSNLVLEVPWMGISYRPLNVTVYGQLTMAWVVGVLAMTFRRFYADMKAGVAYARLRVVAFSFLFVSALLEAAVGLGWAALPFMPDLGFLAVSVALLIETIHRVVDDAHRLEAARSELQIEVSRRTEERDQAREALVVAERQAALGQLAAGVGHEINNPLTYIQTNVAVLAHGIKAGQLPGDAVELLEDTLVGTEQIQRVVADLRAYARPMAEERKRVDVVKSLEASLKLVSRDLPLGTQIERVLDATLRVQADPVRLRQVLINLILNAGIALRKAERERPRLKLVVDAIDDQTMKLEVIDNGIGISTEMLPRLGEPYFSTRHGEGGTGLGLFVVRGIVDALGGHLEFESEEGKGTTARIVLPTLASDEFETELPLSRPASIAPNSRDKSPHPRILVVDDDPAVARAIARQLGGAETANGGQAAIDRLLEGPPVDLVLCDVMMPGVSGRDVFETVQNEMPDQLQKLVFVTGGATIQDVDRFLQRDGVRAYAKPLTQESLDSLLSHLC